MPYLTPDSIPADTICRVLIIPNDRAFVGTVTGALEELIQAYNWEKFGALTPDETVEALKPMFDAFCFNQGVCRVIGEIITWPGSTSPDPKWLFCDGASLLRASYPDLFTILGTIYGAVDGTHFNVPDLRGRVGLGVGSMVGGSTYTLGGVGGEETHTLTVTETPGHSHTDTGHTHAEGVALPAFGAALVGVPIPSAIPAVGATGVGFAGISNTGGGGAHNNLAPYLALNYLIVAQQ